MKIFSFFKNRSGKNTESTIQANEMNEEIQAEETSLEEIRPKLSIHPMWTIPNDKKYVLSFLNHELPPMKPNQVSISNIDYIQEEDHFIFSIFIRNSLNQSIHLGETTLLLLDEDQQMIARKTFDLAEVGEIPPCSNRPWQLSFHQSELMGEIPERNWRIAFELKPKHSLDLDPSWKEKLSNEQVQNLKDMVNDLTPPKENEVNFFGIKAEYGENNDLIITLFIRNGRKESISIQQLPLQVKDSKGEIIAKGSFQLKDLTIKANTTKPWTFIFPSNVQLIKNANLTKWSVEVIQHT